MLQTSISNEDSRNKKEHEPIAITVCLSDETSIFNVEILSIDTIFFTSLVSPSSLFYMLATNLMIKCEYNLLLKIIISSVKRGQISLSLGTRLVFYIHKEFYGFKVQLV